MNKNTLTLNTVLDKQLRTTVPWLSRHYYSLDFPHISLNPLHSLCNYSMSTQLHLPYICQWDTGVCQKALPVVQNHNPLPTQQSYQMFHRYLTFNLSKLAQNWAYAHPLNLQACSFLSVPYLNKRTTTTSHSHEKTLRVRLTCTPLKSPSHTFKEPKSYDFVF